MRRSAPGYFVAVLVAAVSWPSRAQDITTDDLVKACARKTTVMESVNGKIERVGEKLDGYCAGYLSGTFYTLLGEGKLCAGEHDENPDYLASVFQLYATRGESKPGKNASMTVRKAFIRAFPCKPKGKNH